MKPRWWAATLGSNLVNPEDVAPLTEAIQRQSSGSIELPSGFFDILKLRGRMVLGLYTSKV